MKRVFSHDPIVTQNLRGIRAVLCRRRNTFLDAPRVLEGSLCLKEHPNVFFAGQITGFEGYMESAASGLLAARNLYARLEGKVLPPPPVDTMCGALIQYLTTENKHFQPMGANMGILPRCRRRKPPAGTSACGYMATPSGRGQLRAVADENALCGKRASLSGRLLASSCSNTAHHFPPTGGNLSQRGSPWQNRKHCGDCQGLSLWERWHCEAMTERARIRTIRKEYL